MRVTLIDGTYKGNKYGVSEKLKHQLREDGHEVICLVLAEMKIAYCQGCWSCWVATPGKCIHNDDTQTLLRETINSDVAIHITENKFSTVTSFTKKALDKSIPLSHPHIIVKNGESRHKDRYKKYPKWGIVVIDSTNNQDVFHEITSYMGRMLSDDREDVIFTKYITDREFDFGALKLG